MENKEIKTKVETKNSKQTQTKMHIIYIFGVSPTFCNSMEDPGHTRPEYFEAVFEEIKEEIVPKNK